MPFVVVIPAVVIVNNGDDNARCFVSCAPFCCLSVSLPKQGLLAEEPLQLHGAAFLTLRAALRYRNPLSRSLPFFFFEFETQDANPSSSFFNKAVNKRAAVSLC